MPDKSKDRDQMKRSLWSYRLGTGRRDKDAIPENFTVTKPWWRPRSTHEVVASIMKINVDSI
jgi:hypothetical protein